jgi:cytochrome c peroxidase
VRKLILGGVGVLAVGGLLVFATDVRPQNIALNDLRFASLPTAPKAPAGNPATKDKVTLGQLHALGVPDNAQLRVSDAGVDDTYAFRTASLRNLTHTAPYMHSGIFDSLRDVLEFYDDVSGRRGRARNAHVSRQQLDPLLRQLRDPDDRAGDLIAFLEALSDDSFDRTVPPRVPSGLRPGGNIQN